MLLNVTLRQCTIGTFGTVRNKGTGKGRRAKYGRGMDRDAFFSHLQSRQVRGTVRPQRNQYIAVQLMPLRCRDVIVRVRLQGARASCRRKSPPRKPMVGGANSQLSTCRALCRSIGNDKTRLTRGINTVLISWKGRSNSYKLWEGEGFSSPVLCCLPSAVSRDGYAGITSPANF